jgi:hypothetical protein
MGSQLELRIEFPNHMIAIEMPLLSDYSKRVSHTAWFVGDNCKTKWWYILTNHFDGIGVFFMAQTVSPLFWITWI